MTPASTPGPGPGTPAAVGDDGDAETGASVAHAVSAGAAVPEIHRTRWQRLVSGRAVPLRFGLLVFVVSLLLSLFLHGGGYFDWTYAICDGLFAFGTGIAISWSSVPAFGQGLFFAIGGYTAALLRNHPSIPTIVVLLIGLLLAAAVAFVFSFLTSRLPFIAFAMLSLVVAQVGYEIVFTENVFGAENGLYGINRGNFFGISLVGNDAFFWYCVGVLAVVSIGALAFYRSVWGRSLRAVRDDDFRAAAIGANPKALRVAAFTLAGAVCGIAGVLFVELQSVVDPSVAYWTQSADAVVMVVIGGLGTFYGAFGGGVLYEWIYLEVSKHSSDTDLWIGALLVIVVLAAPRGLSWVLGRGISKTTAAVQRRRADHASP
jgi:branched-chain amino acid transport system permease protein